MSYPDFLKKYKKNIYTGTPIQSSIGSQEIKYPDFLRKYKEKQLQVIEPSASVPTMAGLREFEQDNSKNQTILRPLNKMETFLTRSNQAFNTAFDGLMNAFGAKLKDVDIYNQKQTLNLGIGRTVAHSIGRVIGEIMGVEMLSGIGNAVSEGLEKAIGSISLLNPTLSRIITEGTGAAVKWGIRGGLEETGKEIINHELSAKKIGKSILTELPFGYAQAIAGASPNTIKRIASAGGAFGGYAAFRTLLQKHKIEKKDIPQILTSAAVGAILTAIHAPQKSKELQKQDIAELGKQIEKTSLSQKGVKNVEDVQDLLNKARMLRSAYPTNKTFKGVYNALKAAYSLKGGEDYVVKSGEKYVNGSTAAVEDILRKMAPKAGFNAEEAIKVLDILKNSDKLAQYIPETAKAPIVSEAQWKPSAMEEAYLNAKKSINKDIPNKIDKKIFKKIMNESFVEAKKSNKSLVEVLPSVIAKNAPVIHSGKTFYQRVAEGKIPEGNPDENEAPIPVKESINVVKKNIDMLTKQLTKTLSEYQNSGQTDMDALKARKKIAEIKRKIKEIYNVSPYKKTVKPIIDEFNKRLDESLKQVKVPFKGEPVSKKETIKPTQKKVVKSKEPWEMTREEFAKTNPKWQSEIRIKSFEDWAKEKGIKVPDADFASIIWEAIIPNKTASMKGKLKGEIKRYAHVKALYQQYLKEVPVKKQLSEAKDIQIKVLHKRAIRQALKAGKPVPEKVLSEYPDLKRKVQPVAKEEAKQQKVILEGKYEKPKKVVLKRNLNSIESSFTVKGHPEIFANTTLLLTDRTPQEVAKWNAKFKSRTKPLTLAMVKSTYPDYKVLKPTKFIDYESYFGKKLAHLDDGGKESIPILAEYYKWLTHQGYKIYSTGNIKKPLVLKRNNKIVGLVMPLPKYSRLIKRIPSQPTAKPVEKTVKKTNIEKQFNSVPEINKNNYKQFKDGDIVRYGDYIGKISTRDGIMGLEAEYKKEGNKLVENISYFPIAEVKTKKPIENIVIKKQGKRFVAYDKKTDVVLGMGNTREEALAEAKRKEAVMEKIDKTDYPQEHISNQKGYIKTNIISDMYNKVHDWLISYGRLRRENPEAVNVFTEYANKAAGQLETKLIDLEKELHEFIGKIPAKDLTKIAIVIERGDNPKDFFKDPLTLKLAKKLININKKLEDIKFKNDLTGDFRDALLAQLDEKITKLEKSNKAKDITELTKLKELRARVEKMRYLPRAILLRKFFSMSPKKREEFLRKIKKTDLLQSSYQHRKSFSLIEDWIEKDIIKPYDVNAIELTAENYVDTFTKLTWREMYKKFEETGLIKKANDKLKEMDWVTPKSLGIRDAYLNGKLIHPALAEAFEEFIESQKPEQGVLGNIKRFLNIVKIAQFIKPQIIWVYDFIQLAFRGMYSANPIVNIKTMKQATQSVLKRDGLYKKLTEAGLFPGLESIPKAFEAQEVERFARQFIKENSVFRRKIENITGRGHFLTEDNIAKSIKDVLTLYTDTLGRATWEGDKIMRTFGYLILRKMGYSHKEAVKRAKAGLGDYSLLSNKYKRFMSFWFFVYAFRLLMPIEQAKTFFIEPVQAILDVRHGIKLPKYKVESLIKAIIGGFAVIYAVYYFAKSLGFKPSGKHLGKLAWKFTKEITHKGKKMEIVLGVNDILNIGIKYWNRFTTFDPTNPTSPALQVAGRVLKWEVQPVYRIAYEILANKPSFSNQPYVYDPNDPVYKQLEEILKYTFEQSFRVFATIDDMYFSSKTSYTKTQQKIINENLTTLQKVLINIFGYTYVRSDTAHIKSVILRELKAARTRRLKEVVRMYEGEKRKEEIKKVNDWYKRMYDYIQKHYSN